MAVPLSLSPTKPPSSSIMFPNTDNFAFDLAGSSAYAGQATTFPPSEYAVLREQIAQETFAPNALGMMDNSNYAGPSSEPATSLNWPSRGASEWLEEDGGWTHDPETHELVYVPPESRIEELDENDEPIPNNNAYANMPTPPAPAQWHTELPEVDCEDCFTPGADAQTFFTPKDVQEDSAPPESALDSRDIIVLVQVSALIESAVLDLNNVAVRSKDDDGLSTACECLLSPIHSIRDALLRRVSVLADEWHSGSGSWHQRYEERVSSLSRTLSRIRSIAAVALRPRRPKSEAKFRQAACGKLHAHEHKLKDLASKFHASFDRLHARHRHTQATSIYGYRVEQRRKASITHVNGSSGGDRTSTLACRRQDRRPSLTNLNACRR